MTKSEKKVYEDALELFDYSCAICKRPYEELHHIRYGGVYGGRKTYEGNVIPLCKMHHMEVHTNKKKYLPMLIEMYERRKNERML